MNTKNPPLTKCPACGSRKYVISIFGRICPDCFYEEKNDTSVSDCCGSTINWDDNVPYCNNCKKFCQIKQLHDIKISKL